MKVVQSELIGKQFEFGILRNKLEELGFIFGETFTYTYGVFDYELHKSKIEYDYYVRIFVDVIKGRLERSDTVVQVNNIEVFKAMYHNGIFRDDEVPADYVKQADALLKKVHQELGVSAQYTIA